jgi:hypothetical protein
MLLLLLNIMLIFSINILISILRYRVLRAHCHCVLHDLFDSMITHTIQIVEKNHSRSAKRDENRVPLEHQYINIVARKDPRREKNTRATKKHYHFSVRVRSVANRSLVLRFQPSNTV